MIYDNAESTFSMEYQNIEQGWQKKLAKHIKMSNSTVWLKECTESAKTQRKFFNNDSQERSRAIYQDAVSQ